MKHIHEYIIIILVFLSVCYSTEFALFAVSPLGKLAATILIFGYSAVNEIYGLIVCAIIILYYQMDYVENIQHNQFDWRKTMGELGKEAFDIDSVASMANDAWKGFQKNMSSLAWGDYENGGEHVDEINKNSKTSKMELHAIFYGMKEKSIEFINGSFL